MKLRESIFTKQIETDRSVQTVWCEYAWKMSVNSKGSTLSIVTTITRNCVHPFHQTGSVGEGSDHLQLIKFWPSRAPGKGSAAGSKIFGSSLLRPARSVCVSPSSFFIYYVLQPTAGLTAIYYALILYIMQFVTSVTH